MDSEPTLGELYDLMSPSARKKAFFLLFGICEFYGATDTWFATTTIADPPAGRITTDYRLDEDGLKHRLGGRARLAKYLVIKVFKEALTRKKPKSWKAETLRLRKEFRYLATSWDCDTGANGSHPDYCRVCTAEKLSRGEGP